MKKAERNLGRNMDEEAGKRIPNPQEGIWRVQGPVSRGMVVWSWSPGGREIEGNEAMQIMCVG